jgi:hypothetical protein
MKKNLIPGQAKEVEKSTKPAPPQSGELLLLQFNDHVRNITKSLSAMGDIATVLYNEILARQQAAKPEG